MFSVFDASLPDEIHLSKLSVWLSSQKGAEISLVKAGAASEVIRLEVEEGLKAATAFLVQPLAEPMQFNPNRIFTYYDYQKCLTSIADGCGPKGEKNMFGAYTEPCLVTVSTALAKWEANHLHLLSSSEILTKLVLLTHPVTKQRVEKLHNRSEELTRQISEHERVAQSYSKRCKDLCQHWRVSIPITSTSADHVSSNSNSNSSGTISYCQSNEVSLALKEQLESCASAANRQHIFESKILTQINTPEFLECFLYYHSFLTFLDCKLQPPPASSSFSAGALPLLQLALRTGNSLTDKHSSQLFQTTTCPKSTSRASLDSTSSGDDWTHVSASDVTESGDGGGLKVSADVPDHDVLGPEDFLQRLVDDSISRDALIQEVVLLKGFFLSQLKEGIVDKERSQHTVDITHMLSSSSSSSSSLPHGYKPRSADFLHLAGATTQGVLDCFGSEEFLNMLALENNPIYLSRIHQEIVLHHTKSVLFGGMAKRETQERADLKVELTKVKQDLQSVKEKVISLKAALEASLVTLFSPPSLVKSSSPRSVTIVGGDFDQLA